MLPTSPCRTRVCRMTLLRCGRPFPRARRRRQWLSSRCLPLFRVVPRFSLEPLRELGPEALAATDVPGVVSITLCEIKIICSNGRCQTHTAQSTTSLMPRTPAPPTARQFPARADSPGRPCESSSPMPPLRAPSFSVLPKPSSSCRNPTPYRSSPGWPGAASSSQNHANLLVRPRTNARPQRHPRRLDQSDGPGFSNPQRTLLLQTAPAGQGLLLREMLLRSRGHHARSRHTRASGQRVGPLTRLATQPGSVCPLIPRRGLPVRDRRVPGHPADTRRPRDLGAELDPPWPSPVPRTRTRPKVRRTARSQHPPDRFLVGRRRPRFPHAKIIVKWFKGHEMALAMGLQLAIARLGTAVALSSSLPVALKFGHVSCSCTYLSDFVMYWITFVFCLLCSG